MAIYSAVPPPPEYTAVPLDNAAPAAPANQTPATPSQNQSATDIDIDTWTISALQSLSVSPVARGTGTPLAIPIDGERTVAFATEAAKDRIETPRRPPSRRDSMKRREALLKGKEGSRQRRRWENDHLLGVPNAQPPQPVDWEVRPTHPTHRVPYQLAQFWDRGVRQRVEDKTARLAAQRKRQQLVAGSATGLGWGEVPRDLRETAKRSPVVKSWVRALEEPVRQFLHSRVEEEDDEGSLDSEDEEIVFVGRRAAAAVAENGPRGGWKMAHRETEKETVDQGMVFDSFGEGEGASFRRWLTHSISDYYGLESTSVTMSNPSRKVVYVRIKQMHQRAPISMKKFPRPLWELC